MSLFNFDDISYSRETHKTNKHKHSKQHKSHKHKHNKSPKKSSKSRKYGQYRRHKSSKIAYGSITDHCSVCLDNTTILDTRLFPCKHAFHGDCLIEWIQQSGKHNCPLCRQDINHFVQIKPNEKLISIWNEKNFSQSKPKIIEPNIDKISKIMETENETKIDTVLSSSVFEIIGKKYKFIVYKNNNIGFKHYLNNYILNAIKLIEFEKQNELLLKTENNININEYELYKYIPYSINNYNEINIEKEDKIINIPKTEIIFDKINLINLESGLIGGFSSLCSSLIINNLIKNKIIAYDIIPRMGIYFTTYEYLKNKININNNNNNNINKFETRFLSGVTASSLSMITLKNNLININPCISLRFGIFFSCFELNKDLLLINNDKQLPIFDVFKAATIGGLIASSIYYPINNIYNGSNIKNIYKGFNKHIIKFLPGTVACSCAFEYSKRYLNNDV